LAEREDISLDAAGEERDLERALLDLIRLAEQLVEALPVSGAVAVCVGVDSMGVAGRLPIDRHAERDGHHPARGRSEHEVDVARVEAKREASLGAGQHARTAFDGPLAAE